MSVGVIAARKSHGRCAHGILDAITIVVTSLIVAVAVRTLAPTVNALVDGVFVDRIEGAIGNPL